MNIMTFVNVMTLRNVTNFVNIKIFMSIMNYMMLVTFKRGNCDRGPISAKMQFRNTLNLIF